MAIVDVPWDWFVFIISSLLIYSKSQKVSASYRLPFQLPTTYRFSTAKGRISLWADSASRLPPACLGLNERLKAIESSSTANAEAIEMIEMTYKDIDTTVKDVEQDTSFIKAGDKDKLLPLRELERLDKQLRMI